METKQPRMVDLRANVLATVRAYHASTEKGITSAEVSDLIASKYPTRRTSDLRTAVASTLNALDTTKHVVRTKSTRARNVFLYYPDPQTFAPPKPVKAVKTPEIASAEPTAQPQAAVSAPSQPRSAEAIFDCPLPSGGRVQLPASDAAHLRQQLNIFFR